jgi:putative transposase
VVHCAGIQDRIGARAVLIRLFRHFEGLQTVFLDGGYSGKLLAWGQAMFGWLLVVVKRTEAHTFKVLPKRWIVERSFAWINHSRRLSKDYELLPAISETMIQIAFVHLLLRRY